MALLARVSSPGGAECWIYSVRVLGARLTGKGSVFGAGLRWAIDNGMNVVNMSLSTGKRDYFELFHELADEAYFRRIVLVSAVNNVDSPSYPSLYASVLSVAAHAGKDPFEFDYNPILRWNSARRVSTSKCRG